MTATSHRYALAFLACVATFGACSTSTSDREACYARAEAVATETADKLCPVGDAGADAAAWADCSARSKILDDLATAYKGCP